TERTYKVKSTAISVLALGQPNPAYGQFGSKANLSEVLSDGSSLGIESGITLTMDLFDGNAIAGGKPDSLGITLYRKNGGIWYSNNWVVNKTVMKKILSGEVSVNGTSASTRSSLIDLPITYHSGNDEKVTEEPEDYLNVRVYGNPSSSSFNVLIQGGRFAEPVNLRVFDAYGKLIETRQHLYSHKMISIGENYRVGVHFAEFIQGKQRKVVKLIKQ
ncbi:MAG: T9SS type A sorting domain-containing protein, partial [Chitinophagaceae bacterium]